MQECIDESKIYNYKRIQPSINKTLWSVNIGVVQWRINCECGGIVRVRNDIFSDTIPYKYPYFSPFLNKHVVVVLQTS